MKLLVIPGVWAYGLGPLTQCLGVADAAAERGHEVAVLCSKKLAGHVSQAGHHAYQAPEPPGPLYPDTPVYRLSDLITALGVADESFIRSSLEAELFALNDFKADAVFTAYQLTAPISAHIAGVSVASICTWPDHPDFTSPLFDDLRSDNTPTEIFKSILEEFRQPTIHDVADLFFVHSDLKIIPSFPIIDGEYFASLPNGHHVGHLTWERLEETAIPIWLRECEETPRPLILVYFSVGDINPKLCVQTIPKAFASEPFRLVVATGLHGDLKVPESTDRIRFEQFVPAREVLQRSSLLIFHAGYNTLMNALTCGVPCLAFPGLDAERRFYANRIQELGVGRCLLSEDFTPSHLLRETQEILAGPIPQQASEISHSLPDLGGARRVVDLLEEV